MNRLWAPWRVNYIQSKKKSKKCLFCSAAKDKGAELVVFKSAHTVCLLNLYPYNNGHLLCAPRRHVKDTALLKDAELLDLFKTIEKAKSLLKKHINPQGFNIGINISGAAGAGIPDHVHVHIVPRWKGDTNFMPVTGNTKIISQSLKELHRMLTRC